MCREGVAFQAPRRRRGRERERERDPVADPGLRFEIISNRADLLVLVC